MSVQRHGSSPRPARDPWPRRRATPASPDAEASVLVGHSPAADDFRPDPGGTAARGARWHDSLSLGQLAVVAMLALASALTAWGLERSDPGEVRVWVRDYIGLQDPLIAAYVFAIDLATGILTLIALAAVVHYAPRHSARQYLLLALGVSLAGGVRLAVSYALATHWTFELHHIVPYGYFNRWVPNSPETDAVLYTTTNRLREIFKFWLYPAALGMVFGGVYLYFRAQAAAAADLAASTVAAERALEQTTEARLQMLEAQIEPHFLFNTLANVKRLYQTEPGTGRRMLDNLMRYLQEALPRMREGDHTLGRDVALTEAYLGVQQIRMGSRLSYSVDVSDDLRTVRLPPMVVLTLAENAIKHGLNPLPQGGSLSIRASREGEQVVVRIADTGRGFAKTSGGGTGLANVRARLSLAFGDAASLQLRANSPGGVVATIAVPATPHQRQAAPALEAAE
jgi:hypothetical protein